MQPRRVCPTCWSSSRGNLSLWTSTTTMTRILVSCKVCEGFLFENDGTGAFTDVTQGRLPQFTNNYDFEAMDVNGDDYLDLVTTNDGPYLDEHLFLNDRKGGFNDATARLWPNSENVGSDDWTPSWTSTPMETRTCSLALWMMIWVILTAC